MGKYLDNEGLKFLWFNIRKAIQNHHDDTKQNALIPGDNITLDGNVISATGGGSIDDVLVDGVSAVTNKVANIELKPVKEVIPEQASKSNKLADKDYVIRTISKSAGDFKGIFESLEELQSVKGNINDYAFLKRKDALGNTCFDFYGYEDEEIIDLPDNYEKVEYIRGAGPYRYIDTGIVPGEDIKIEAVFKVCFPEGMDEFIFGSSISDMIFYGVEFSRTMIRVGDCKINGKTLRNIDVDTEYKIGISESGIYINNEYVADFVYEEQPFRSIYLFYTNCIGENDYSTSSLRDISRFKVWKSDELIADYIPCKNPDGIYGFYDLVSESFKSSEGSKEFIGVETNDNWKLVYTIKPNEFTKRQWIAINSGVSDKISSLENDAGYLTLDTLPTYDGGVE